MRSRKVINMSNQAQKNEITQAFMNVSLVPDEVKQTIALKEATAIPFDDLMVMGSAIASIAVSLKDAFSKSPYKLYQAFDAEGNPMKELPYRFKDRPGFSNLYRNSLGEPHAADMREVKMPADSFPGGTIVAIAAAVVIRSIEKKLDTIQETQQEILDFLRDDKRASLKADIDFLMDILNNYKHNWDNMMYKTNMHIKVLDIKQSAEQNIEFYRSQLEKRFEKKGFLMTERGAKDKLTKMQADLEDYRVALNLYGFASFVEILLLENYSSAYLEAISSKIKDLSMQYRERYSECYARIEKFLKTSVNSFAVKSLAAASKFTGETIAKIPLVSRGRVDENLIEANSKLNEWNDGRPEQILRRLTSCKDASANLFAENIDSINQIYNRPTELYFDSEGIYLMPA